MSLYFKYYSDEKDNMNFEGFNNFCREFDIFP